MSVLAAPAPVYLVIGSDTDLWNKPGGLDLTSRHPHYPQQLFTDPLGAAYSVMDPAFRNSVRDSFGQPLKLTWWVMAGNIFRDADNLNVPSANMMNFHLLKKYHGAAIAQHGDELTLHYHTFLWSDYNGDGTNYWNQAHTFDECRSDFDFTLAQCLVDEGVFPVSFRSGWHYMDNAWQQRLNEILPFCLHNASPRRSVDTTEPIGNVLDWSQATTNFIPYQPAQTNYQTVGEGPGWEVRSVKMLEMTEGVASQIFSQADGGTTQVACLWGHLPESFVTAIKTMASYIAKGASNYPAVPFRYCTASEAMQRWPGVSNQSPPSLTVTPSVDAESLSLLIQTDRTIFQPRPFVGIRDVYQQYADVSPLCVATGSNRWTITLPVPRNRVARVGVAVTDSFGNSTNQILRFVPDDIYVDNLDPQYAEVQGSWFLSVNSAWGTDARVARLTNTAAARWSLPIVTSGIYALGTQVAARTNSATNVLFTVTAGSSNLFSLSFSNSLPTNQWVYLGSAFLDAALSNSISMVVPSANQTNRYIYADVVRALPVPEPQAWIETSTNGPRLHFAALPGLRYQIQRSTDFSNWTSIGAVVAPPDSIATYDDAAPADSAAFYRIRLP